MRHYLIIGASFRGRGAEVMILETCKIIRNIDKNAKISIATGHYEYDDNFLRKISNPYNINLVNLNYENNFKNYRTLCFLVDFMFSSIDIMISFINRYLPKKIKLGYFSKMSKYISDSDTILQIAGISFTQKMGIPFALLWTKQMIFSDFLDKKYICMPQSFGPSSLPIKFIAKVGLEKATFIMPRGEKSVEYLDSIKLKNDNIEFVPDLSFSFKNPTNFENNIIYDRLSLDTSKKYVTVMFNSHLYRWAGEKMIYLFSEIIDHLAEIYHYNILLVPLELNDYGIDDKYCNDLILSSCKNKLMINNITEELRANEIKSLLKLCDFSICARFHGMIFSLNMEIPPLVVGWADKYHEIMKLFDLDGLVLDYDEVSIDTLISKSEFIILHESQIIDIIKDKSNEYKSSSESVKNIIERFG